VISLSEKFIFVFLDGVGLGPQTAQNPLSTKANLPFVSSLLGTPLLGNQAVSRPGLLFKPIDARLGVPGLPQSATGQTSLYTGCNAPQFRGQHQTGFANGSLRQLIEAHGIFKQVLHLGGTATLANLYSPQYFYAIAHRRIRYSVGTLLNLTAGLPFRLQMEYEAGEALFWDITGELAHHRGIVAPPIAPKIAGQRLAHLGSRYTITLFESYLTDFAGHSQEWNKAVRVLQRVDSFLESLVNHLDSHTTLVISSDHGNLEDLSTKRHTLNPVPLIAVGPDAQAFAPVQDITGITPAILECLRRRQQICRRAAKTNSVKENIALAESCKVP
jgi:2,3-bisphosphoglycerate-independent phosphoglycerate mutase